MFEVPRLPFPAYAVGLLLAFTFGLLLVRREARKSGLDAALLTDLSIHVVMLSIVGSRVLHVVADGDTISIGKRTLTFLETPMVHWPESMVTYIPEEQLLFSMDAFGQHYAAARRFDDQEPLDTIMYEAKTYYANIVMLYGKPIAKVLEKASGMDIRMIAPSHGVVWRSHIDQIIAAYNKWVKHEPLPKGVVMYDTIEEFYLAEALEYIEAWKQSTPDNPAGICGPIGPTEQLPLVARLVNAMELNLGRLDAHFWGMDEWVLDGQAVGCDHPLSFAKADMELCFDRIDDPWKMPTNNLHFPVGELVARTAGTGTVRATTLDDESRDDPVERQTGVVIVIRE